MRTLAKVFIATPKTFGWQASFIINGTDRSLLSLGMSSLKSPGSAQTTASGITSFLSSVAAERNEAMMKNLGAIRFNAGISLSREGPGETTKQSRPTKHLLIVEMDWHPRIVGKLANQLRTIRLECFATDERSICALAYP